MSDNLSKEYIHKIIEELVSLGEDKEELSLWLTMYEAMIPEEQKKLVKNLEDELEELQKLK